VSTPFARVVHSIPGRARLRTAGIKGDRAALSALQSALEDAPGVKSVQANPTTGSFVVEHEGNIDDVLQAVEARGALLFEREVGEPYLATLNRALIETDRRLQRDSKGKLNLETISFFGFVAGGVYQMFNHHGLPAGVTMLRYAVELVTATALQQVRQAAANLPPVDGAPKP
jgi:cation transport ATPase